MAKMEFAHGGSEYDRRYPDGIPTSLVITMNDGTSFDSGLVMYPAGHARNTTANLKDILLHKAKLLGALSMSDFDKVIARFNGLAQLSTADLAKLYDFAIETRDGYE